MSLNLFKYAYFIVFVSLFLHLKPWGFNLLVCVSYGTIDCFFICSVILNSELIFSGFTCENLVWPGVEGGHSTAVSTSFCKGPRKYHWPEVNFRINASALGFSDYAHSITEPWIFRRNRPEFLNSQQTLFAPSELWETQVNFSAISLC